MAQKDEQREIDALLEKIDIPFFRNNPEYLDQWAAYFKKSEDPRILLLMYYKEIGTFYHWLYVEFSRHFVKIRKAEIAHFILTEAISNGVYDRNVLQAELDGLPAFKKVYKRADLACILKQNNIKALGRVWNAFKEVEFYSKHLHNGRTFEIMKMQEYSEMYCTDESMAAGNDANDGNNNLPGYEIKSIVENDNEEIKSKGLCEKIIYYSRHKEDENGIIDALLKENERDGSSKENEQNELVNSSLLISNEILNDDCKPCGPVDNICRLHDGSISSIDIADNTVNDISIADNTVNDISIIADNTANLCNFDSQIPVLKGNLGINEELYLRDYVYIVQEFPDSKKEAFVALRIAFGKDEAHTIAGKSFYFQAIPQSQSALVAMMYDVCAHNGAPYAYFEYDFLTSLETALRYCQEYSKLFYLHQALVFLDKCRLKGILFQEIDFFVDQSFNLHLFCVNFQVYSDKGNRELLGRLMEYFSMDGVSLDEIDPFTDRIGRILLEPSFKRELLSHKNAILENAML